MDKRITFQLLNEVKLKLPRKEVREKTAFPCTARFVAEVKRVFGFTRVRLPEMKHNIIIFSEALNRKGRRHDEHERMEYRQREASDAMYLASLIYIYRENDR